MFRPKPWRRLNRRPTTKHFENYIYFQKGKPDQFIHHYKYDFDNRLKEVWTSNDGQVWDRDVNYEYREDGYLARTELGEMKVQGMDYAYTLHGWIKTLNSGVLNPDYDMGKDGDLANNAQYDAYESNIHDLHARDVLSYTVGYYNGDYLQISSGTGYNNMMVSMTGNIASDIDELFNGNITSYISGTTDTDGNKLNPLAISYHYDQLHRFKESHVFTYTDIISSNSTLNAVRANTTGPGGLGDYEMHVNYDMNGNITDLDRQAYSATNDMDEFTYNYISNTNKLDYVTDAETGTGSSGYGDIQHGQTSGNYLYHDDGSLKKDLDEEIEYIDWYPNGLVKRIYRTSTSTLSDLYFEYDPTGNRVLKVEITRTSTTINPSEDWIYTYYATDANGITMAVYDLNPDDTDPDVLTKNEQMLYGGSRLGMETTPTVVSTAVDVINDCNNDGLASGVLEFTPGAISNGVVVEIMLDNIVIGDITYNTSNSLLVNLETLKDEINAQAEGYYVELIDESFLVYLRLKETIAGSLQSRELIVELDDTNTPSYVEREITIGNCAENRTLGKKFYELSNYLGNVMEVISDRKIAHNNAGTVDYFEADVVSYSDYYPFGMEMPNRKGTASYRYAYNGMEVDPEVSGGGNSYTTQFRQYDPRLGRWKSLDPLAPKFPGCSPYMAFYNNSIIYVDPKGLESVTKIIDLQGTVLVDIEDGSDEVFILPDRSKRFALYNDLFKAYEKGAVFNTDVTKEVIKKHGGFHISEYMKPDDRYSTIDKYYKVGFQAAYYGTTDDKVYQLMKFNLGAVPNPKLTSDKTDGQDDAHMYDNYIRSGEADGHKYRRAGYMNPFDPKIKNNIPELRFTKERNPDEIADNQTDGTIYEFGKAYTVQEVRYHMAKLKMGVTPFDDSHPFNDPDHPLYDGNLDGIPDAKVKGKDAGKSGAPRYISYEGE